MNATLRAHSRPVAGPQLRATARRTTTIGSSMKSTPAMASFAPSSRSPALPACSFTRAVRSRPSSSIAPPQALAGSGGGDTTGGGGGGKSFGGGGGGGGGGSSDDASSPSSPSSGPFAALLAGWAARVAADPQFPYKVLVEQIIGVGAAVLGDMSSRPNWGLGELDFVFSTLVVGSILNFSLMYLLAPVAAAKAASSASTAALVGRLVSGAPLAKVGAPVGHMFQSGDFTLASRAANALYKGGVFAAVGFGAGVAGTATSNALLAVRERLGHPSPNRPPAVLANAGCWAAHMGVSSNLRYQALNGLDGALAPVLPGNVFKLWSVAVRCANNVAGGMSFVFLARLLGVQEAAGEAPATSKGKGKEKGSGKDEKKKR